MKLLQGSKAVITFDEIQAYDRQNQLKLLEMVDQLKAEGHKIVFSVIGDLQEIVQKSYPEKLRINFWE